jgi:CHAT domain-containing protein
VALLAQDAATDWSTPLAELCDAAWSPWAGAVSTTRVALVPDAVLQGVPWAALRCPDASGARTALVERYELLQLPALRSLLRPEPAAAAPREGPPAGAAPAGALAVVDPVYDRSDRRLGAAAVPGSTVAASDALVLRGRSLVRLGATRDEAVLLERLLGQGNVTVLDGFEANRTAVLDRLSRPARLVHFGTHGVVSGNDLAGSGLVLSLLDREAHAREGFLSARELARLDVPAELVVMAACESGFGAAVVGEGMQSLAYGFLAAGARTVVGASWPVADVPTSRLMAEFYRALLEQHASPAAALRAAQRTLGRDPYWRHPRFWAGFSVSGATPSDP